MWSSGKNVLLAHDLGLNVDGWQSQARVEKRAEPKFIP
jgi:hypothetical protein